MFGVGTAWLPWVTSLIGVLHAHGSEIFHVLWAIVLAITAAPSAIPLLALRIVHHGKLLTVWERNCLARTTPISSWLHTVIGKVLELAGTVLGAEEACTCVTGSTLRIAAVETRFLAFFTLFD